VIRQYRVSSTIIALCWACGAAPEASPDVDPADSAFSLELTAEQTSGVLLFVNDCATTVQVLDVDARLDKRAASNIVAHRDGTIEGECGAGDRFDDLDELDKVAYVGDVGLGRIVSHAETLGFIDADGGTYDGVALSDEASVGVLAVANGASFETLDRVVGLDVRASRAIVAARPYANPVRAVNMKALAATRYVGASALRKLDTYGARWVACPADGADVEGVLFSNLDAHDVLDLANNGDTAALKSISGIGGTIAGRLSAARPFEAVTDIGAVSGIGRTVLGHLRDQVSTKWCPTTSAACGCASEPPPQPDLPQVAFDENGLYQFLWYRDPPWEAERAIESGFLSHDGSQVVLTDVSVTNDPDQWLQIAEDVFDRLWSCCLRYQYFGDPLEIGRLRKGTLHFGRLINTTDGKPYVMAYWRDIDDASFAWAYERRDGRWVMAIEVFLN